MAYEVRFKKSAIKELATIAEPFRTRILDAVKSLAANPRPVGVKKLKGQIGYRIRIADYRVIYTIEDDALIVEIVKVGHRREIYD
jgi:mRNA interferase RelE/StbE